MIWIKDESKKKLKNITLDNYYVVADFDRILSTRNSKTTFSLFGESGFYGEEYSKERRKLYEHYRPLELDTKIPDSLKYEIMEEWQRKSYQLMLKYRVRESDIKKILSTTDLLELRDGAIEFIDRLNENNIPLIINSAGCGNFIIELLKLNNCCSDNIYLHSNLFTFREDIMIDSIEKIVHSMSKYDINLPTDFFNRLLDKKYSIVIGDQLTDLEMAKNLPKKEIISFGFLEEKVEELEPFFQRDYGVILKEMEDFTPIHKVLRLKK